MELQNPFPGRFCVGFGKVDVTPFENVHLGSYNNGMQRLSNKIEDEFDALTLAITDEEGDTVILIVTDLSWGHHTWSARVRERLWDKYGIPGDHISLGGTHNHNGPDWYSEAAETEVNTRYLNFWLEGVIKSVDMALADRKPAKFMVGRTATKGVGFNRRYFRSDGVLAGGGYQKYYINSPCPLVSHEAPADEEVQLVKIVRQGSKDILVGQWQNHGCHVGMTYLCCTDWIGPMREKVEANIDAHYIYFQGAAGNMATKSRLYEEYPRDKTRQEIGENVADVVIDAWNNPGTFKEVKTGKIRVNQDIYTGLGAGPMGGEPTEDNIWEGEMNTMSFGDVSLVSFPTEMFASLGQMIKARTPFEMTILMGYANGIHGYVGDSWALSHGGYEGYSRAAPGTGEQMVDLYIQRLTEQYYANETEAFLSPEAEMARKFDGLAAGFGKADVTPRGPVYLGGFRFGENRLSLDVQREFEALTLAVTDKEGKTLLFIVSDLAWGTIELANRVRDAVAETYGIPKNHVMVAGLKNHNAPATHGDMQMPELNESYFDHWLGGVMVSVQQALADRKCAKMEVGRTKTDKLSFVRRYYRPDGIELAGDPNIAATPFAKYYKFSSGLIISHETEIDEEIQMVKFTRDGGKDILIGQWQCCGDHVGPTRHCCSDWLFAMRQKVEQELDCHYLYLQGAAGNIATRSRFGTEYPVERSREQLGQQVADAVISACKDSATFSPAAAGSVKADRDTITVLGPKPIDGAEADREEWTGEMNTLSFGDVSVVTFPVDMFDTTGKEIKAATPFAMTLLMGYANAVEGYAPDRKAYLNGGHEAYSRGVEGTAEEMVATYLKRLHQQKEN